MAPPPDSAALDAEARAALARAARLAGDPGLVGALERVVLSYLRDREAAGSAPRLGRLHHRLRDRARSAEALRRDLADPWERQALAGVGGPIHPDLDAIERGLAEYARLARVAAAGLDPDDRRSADRRPGSPRWRLGWALAEMWSDAGRYVGIGIDSNFHSFASEAFAVAGEAAPERLLREVAERWQASSRTVGGRKPPVPSLHGTLR